MKDSRLLLFTYPKNCEAFLEHASTASDIVFTKSFATCCWLVPETNKIGHVLGSLNEGFVKPLSAKLKIKQKSRETAWWQTDRRTEES